MAVVDVFQNQREFRCNHCSGKILVPKDLPPMTGPCPHCGSTITSPGPEADGPAPQKVGVVVEVPAVERVAEPRKCGGPPPLPPVKPAPEVVAVNPVSVAVNPGSVAVVEDRSAAIAAEKALAEEQALEAERALARERAAAIAAEKAVAEEKALAAERALAEQRAQAERAQAVEKALAEERALAAEQAHARERALAEERAAAVEKSRAMEAALAAERAQAEERARAMEKALEEERTLARERALAQERALAIAAEKSLAEEQARAAERALAAEKALAEAKAQEIERQLAREKALAEEKAAAAEKAMALAAERALAAEKAAAAEKALADEKALAEEKARVAERALAEAAEKAQAAERALAQERALAREKALAAEKALAEERALALAAETALAAQKAAAHEQFLAREHEQARAKAQAEEREAARRRSFEAPAVVASPAAPATAATPVAEAAPAAEPLAPLPPELATPLPKTSEKPHRNKVRKSAKKSKPAKPPGPASRKALVVSMLVLLALILGGGGLAIHFLDQRGRQQAVAKRPGLSPEQQALIAEKQYLQSGWQEDAKQVLSEFLAAETVSGKAAFSLRGSELIGTMESFYGAGKIDDSDTPPSGFSAEPLPPDDQKRGIFMMRYEQPPQFEMRDFFRPLAPLEVQYGLQEPDLLLSSLAKAGNFASEPVKVHAFFKRGPDGLRLDWETFIQTKHRTFRTFTELPDPGRSEIFRLFVVEDVPEKGKEETGMKTYRMIDPAHKTDSVRVDVKVDSELGRSLSILNWRGVKDGRPKTRTATLELEWTRDEVPRLALKRFLCWEFLGIGGQGSGTPTGK